MYLILSALPVLAVIVAMLAGVRSLYAALLGIVMALLAMVLAFPVSSTELLHALRNWLPILVEVLLIVGGGLLLSQALQVSGAQKALAHWLQGQSGQGVGAVLLVVHGITPFAESLTGFGIGITIGIPLLLHSGLSVRKVAVIGLLGLCAVPWGSMGPGTLIAASMAGLSPDALGLASAMVSVIPFVITGVAAAWLASAPGQRLSAVLQGFVSGLVLTLAVTAMNALVGMAPAGALGSLMVIALYLLRGRWARRVRIAKLQRSSDGAMAGSAEPEAGASNEQGEELSGLGGLGRRALAAYGVLLLGVLLARFLVRWWQLPPLFNALASPALWLLVATAFFARGLPAPAVLAQAAKSWRQVAPVTGMFIVLGVLMAVSGMAAQLAQTLAQGGSAYLLAAPFVGALGGFVTGSNTGANAMFAATQAEIAQVLQVGVLPFMAVHNVSASLLLMASPGKIEMACHLASVENLPQRRWVQVQVLLIDLLAISLMALLNVALAWR